MTIRKMLAAAVVALCIPAAPAAADPLEPGQVLHHVQVQVMAGDRNNEVEMTRSSTAFHRVVRDRDHGGKILYEQFADARSGRISTYDGRRDVRYDKVCKPVAKRMVAVEDKPGEAVEAKIASGEYTVVAEREEFGRSVLDLTGDIGEPDVGPQRIDLTVDEATGTALALTTGRGARVWTTAFSVRSGSASPSLSAAARDARVRTRSCS
jgi:hypothetical protein